MALYLIYFFAAKMWNLFLQSIFYNGLGTVLDRFAPGSGVQVDLLEVGKALLSRDYGRWQDVLKAVLVEFVVLGGFGAVQILLKVPKEAVFCFVKNSMGKNGIKIPVKEFLGFLIEFQWDKPNPLLEMPALMEKIYGRSVP